MSMSGERDLIEVLAQAIEYLLAARGRELGASQADSEERALVERLRDELQAVRAQQLLSQPEAG